MKSFPFFKANYFLALPLVLSAGMAGAQQCGRLPNIVFILTDDHGSGDNSAYNLASKIQTPQMDRLAAEGMRFTDAHSSSAVCTPSRYSLLTGRYSWRTSLANGVLNPNSPPLIPATRMTLASMLKQKGYHSACIGKWHLGLRWNNVNDWSQGFTRGPTELGFDYFFGIPASLDMADYAYLENNSVVAAPTLPIAASPMPAMWREGLVAPDFRHVEVLPHLTQKAVDYIRQRTTTAPQTPFFLYLPLTSPHTPVVIPDSIERVRIRGVSQEGVRGDFVYMTDWAVGKVLKTLDSLNISNSTMVVLAADNGAMDYSYQQFGHTPHLNLKGEKADIFEAGHRIPLIVRWPGVVAPNRVSNETVCLSDFMATFAAVTNFRLPDTSGEDSYSLLPVLLGRTLTAPLREATVHHSNAGLFAIRRGAWKLTSDNMGSGGFTSPASLAGPGTLYNLVNDISETNNQYANRPNDVTQLRALLTQYRNGTRSTPLPRNDEFWNCAVGINPAGSGSGGFQFKTRIQGAALHVYFGPISAHSVELVTQDGKVVSVRKGLAGQAGYAIDLNGITPGVYVLKINDAVATYSQRVVLSQGI